MTSDERVQIYVPSPQTTPYNTITKSHASLNSTSYVHLRTAALPWGTTGSVREDATPPPFAHRAPAAANESASSFRSVTPLNNGGVETGGSVGGGGGQGYAESATRFHTTSILETSSRSTTATTASTTEVVLEGATEETSLEMVKISINSTSSSSNAESSTTTQQSHQTTVSERTLMDDLPSLPIDATAPVAAAAVADGGTKEPVSLSDIQLEEGT